VFKIKKYPIDFSGFRGRDLTPKSTVEETEIVLSTSSMEPESQWVIYPNPASNSLHLESQSNFSADGLIYNIEGELVNRFTFTKSISLDISNLIEGIYFISSGKSIKRFVVNH